MLPLPLISWALAGEIAVSGLAGHVLVDGREAPYSQRSAAYLAADLAGGTHLVQATGAFGRVLASIQVHVNEDERVFLRYADRSFTVVGSGPLGSLSPTLPPPSSALASVELTADGASVAVGGTVVQAGPGGASVVVDGGTTVVQAGAGQLRVQDGSGGAVTIRVDVDAEEPPPPPPPGPVSMEPARFQRLLASVRGADFSDEKLAVLRTAAPSNFFTSRQVRELLLALDFDDDRLAALQLLADRIVDRENAFVLLDAFDFDDDRQAAQRILSH